MTNTGLIIWVLVIVISLIDLALLFWEGKRGTISFVLREKAKRHPMIPFVCGVLVGHWFWPV